jgi:DNA-binding beta-propeller fold protein YncE
VRSFSRILSSKTSPTLSRSRFHTLIGLLTLSAAFPLFAQATLSVAPTRDRKVIHRWSLAGEPRGIAIGADGTLYVGLAEKQAVVAVDPKTGAVIRELVLDSAEIAATKELVTLRTDRAGKRLYIANGSDESATILSIPGLAVIREITMEGEAIRDALPDPKGRYLFLLGRRVHVFDTDGKSKLRTLPFENPMAIATSSNGATLAVIGTEDFGNAKATVAAMYDTTTFVETGRNPLQTDKTIEAVLFAAADRALVAISRDYLFEKSLVVMVRAPQPMADSGKGPMRMRIDFGDLVNSERVCLPEGSGPQIATLGAAPDSLLFAERRCSSSGSFSGSHRSVAPASLYGVNAYAIAYDRDANTLAVTDRAGYLTIYKVPRVAIAR